MNQTLNLPFADAIPDELLADTQAIIEKLTTGKSLDAETRQRIDRRADEIRRQIFQKHGLVDIGVPAIRELRDT